VGAKKDLSVCIRCFLNYSSAAEKCPDKKIKRRCNTEFPLDNAVSDIKVSIEEGEFTGFVVQIPEA
jgi:ribosomal protein L40E